MTWVAFACGLVLGVPAGIFLAGLCVSAARADEMMVAEVYRRRLAEVLVAQNRVHMRTLGYHAGRERPELRN